MRRPAVLQKLQAAGRGRAGYPESGDFLPRSSSLSLAVSCPFALGFGSSGLDPRELDGSAVHRRGRCKSGSDRRPTGLHSTPARHAGVGEARTHASPCPREIDRPVKASTGSLGLLQCTQHP
jgi:hypothetical protein